MDKIKKWKNNIKKSFFTNLTSKVLNDRNLKILIADMDIHFKITEYKPWPLGYNAIKSESKLCDLEFNILLESLNYKLFYDRNSGLIVFKPESLK